jgi:hypothetical protein
MPNLGSVLKTQSFTKTVTIDEEPVTTIKVNFSITAIWLKWNGLTGGWSWSSCAEEYRV